ncbi:alpha-L-fucosidase [Actinomadura rudentiformis]|uniref:alpha-L-fucosidase n=1 Tax=Actinomadura rudentiformis TaxID=359158 RepID=UPI001CEF69B1|nr:alpha-L-fucosidase [Actinomadura rudentiformis]
MTQETPTGGRMAMPSAVTDRPVPAWFADAKFGIFVHWGAYSVPAWAEPTGELGAMDPDEQFAHNPYAEWYWNTSRIEGSPAHEHQRAVHGGRPYDDFLDAWKAESFDPAGWIDLFARTGARYVVATSKHHDGIALWDAPGTRVRNTVRRGPQRDLIADLATATRARGLRFGTYYSGGLDWWAGRRDVIRHEELIDDCRPHEAAYAAYALRQIRDLIGRYEPDVLWNDIGWPAAGMADLPGLFADYYATVPDGVVNDRWDGAHADFLTSEYQANRQNETASRWEHCRGIGLSFGYNRNEGPEHLLDTAAAVRLLADVVSRGGNLLLNVGPKADGTLPGEQRDVLEGIASWMVDHASAVYATRPFEAAVPSDDGPWIRWTRDDRHAYAFLADALAPATASGEVLLKTRPGLLNPATAVRLGGRPVEARPVPDGVVTSADLDRSLPAVVRFAFTADPAERPPFVL